MNSEIPLSIGNNGGMTTQNSECIFIVTSTINTSLGLIDPPTRFLQTLETIQSIRNKVENSTILLIESSLTGLQEHVAAKLKNSVDYFLDIGARNCLQLLGKHGVKGGSELYILMTALDFIKINKLHANRIFKLSGRYKLTDEFDYSIYKNSNFKNKYSFRKRGRYQDQGPDCFLHTRLWSFDSNLLDETYELLSTSLLTSLKENITIEEAIYKHINFDKLVELEKIHCQGYIAPWNQLITE